MTGMILIPMNEIPCFRLILNQISDASLFILDSPPIIAENSIRGITIVISGANGLVI